MLKSLAATALLTNIFIFGASQAYAASSLTGEVGVKIDIGAGCAIVNGGANDSINQWGTLDFGTHPDLTNVVDAQTVGTSGNIQIQCSTGLTPSLTVNAGLHASGGQRYMQNTTTTTTTSSTIAYNIYSDAARSAPIHANSPVDISSVSTGTAVDIPLYGRVVPTGQTTTTPPAGSYTDTLLVTVGW
ncbi:spore coat U domain-containing protein [Pseudomonas aeruginosa]|uniref:Csu type fimbrial protein n=1 Tax=Pseudomonas aeruginosa TaxID=287 RepID=UPI0021F17A8D|nr:spore coat U domain-containing protein [Pseudomonas aeruginosa]MCV4131060.1 spore coat U domain-containing protein [Pseudomonas aeruginosa]